MAVDAHAALAVQLARQVAHWRAAADELADLSQLAAPSAWRALDRYLGTAIEGSLRSAVDRLRRQGDLLKAQLAAAETAGEIERLRREVLAFRRRFLRVELILDFYGDAINTRTSPELGAYLRACDVLARESMIRLLEPLGRATPPVLTYLDKGLGASILKARLRLWDGRSLAPVAAIKIVRHNMHRPTSLIHEAGHQVAHTLAWVGELASALEQETGDVQLGRLWAGWASEIAADAFAFVHMGHAALAALHDVIAGEAATVLRIEVLDPHPAGYVRVLLGRDMCRSFFGAGPWDVLARAWTHVYRLDHGEAADGELLRRSIPLLPRIVQLVLERAYRAFGGKGLVDLIDPARVKPEALEALERSGGRALYRSNDWIRRECLRLLALSGWRAATQPEKAVEILQQQKEWMRALGELAMAA